MNQYYILKPKNLNLQSLVNKFPPDFKLNLDFAYLIIYLVIMWSDKTNNSKKVQLHSKFLEKLIGRNYHKYIDFLLENYPASGNVLNGYKYKKGFHPFSYKLTNYYFEGGFELYSINDYKLINRIKTVFTKSTNENIRTNYYFLLKYFNDKKLTVYNPFKAIEQTNGLMPQKSLKNALNLLSILNSENKLTLKTTTDGRVHSNITRLSKSSRKYLQYDGEFLAEIDISSAVPYFLFLTMDYYLNNRLDCINEFQYNNPIPFTYMFDEVTGDIDKTELNEFGKSIFNAVFYEQFNELIFSQSFYESKGLDFDKVMKYYQHSFKKMFGYYFDGVDEDLKKFAKRRILSMLFANTKTYKYEQIVFKEIYPTIHKFINEFKDVKQYKDCEDVKWSKKDCHKKLSYFCFQFEAKVMIDKIAREFDKLHKGKVPIFTIHDCILTTTSHAVELKEFILKKFIDLFCNAPNLTLEYSEFYESYEIAS
jgi:hypothetical protein